MNNNIQVLRSAKKALLIGLAFGGMMGVQDVIKHSSFTAAGFGEWLGYGMPFGIFFSVIIFVILLAWQVIRHYFARPDGNESLQIDSSSKKASWVELFIWIAIIGILPFIVFNYLEKQAAWHNRYQQALKEGMSASDARTVAGDGAQPSAQQPVDISNMPPPPPAATFTYEEAIATPQAGWVAVFGNDDATLYVDRSTIRRDGNKVKMWAMFDSKTAKALPGSIGLSMVIQSEFDCKDEMIRSITHSDYSKNMGNGDVVFSGEYSYKWEPIYPNSFGRAQWEVACGNQ